MYTLLTKIAGIILAPFIFVSSLLTPIHTDNIQPVEQPNSAVVGAVLPQATGVFETSLASPINATATSMTLTANSVRGGGAVAGFTCVTVDEGSAQAEVICGTVSGTAVSSLTRGVSYADGITSVTANKFSHRRGANVKITDFPLVQILKAQNNGDETFPNKLSYASDPTFTTSTDIISKGYADTRRVQSVSNAATITPNADSYDEVDITAIAQAFTLANPTGTPSNFKSFIIRIKDNGTGRGITFGNQYRAMGNALPSTTIASKYLILGLLWNSTDSKWDLVSLTNES